MDHPDRRLSVLSLPKRLVADTVARLFAATVDPNPETAVQFPEIDGHTSAITIPTRHGDTDATLYHPPHPEQRPAVYLNMHGGGFAVGNRDQDDPWCRYLAAYAGVVVVNTDYVLTPRHRFPAPVEQIYDVLEWVAAQQSWDGTRLCAGGQSAGGNLAAAASRLALENGGPRILLQVLHYAPLDLVTSTKDKPSPLGMKAVLKPWMGEVFDTAYIPDRPRRRDRLASPAWGSNSADLAGIAPAVVVTAEFDRLRDEAASYADALDTVGALVAHHDVPGVDHGYNLMSDAPAAVAATQHMYRVLAEHVRQAVRLP